MLILSCKQITRVNTWVHREGIVANRAIRSVAINGKHIIAFIDRSEQHFECAIFQIDQGFDDTWRGEREVIEARGVHVHRIAKRKYHQRNVNRNIHLKNGKNVAGYRS